MYANLRRAHDALWAKFFNSESNLLYDVEFTDPAQFPTRPEVAASIPSCAGWETGMEDCALDAGFLLAGLVEGYEVSGEAEWANKARRLFQGLVALGTVGGLPGFVARGYAPGRADVYPNSSADQYTSYVYGMWRYAESSIASSEDRGIATRLIADIARLVESFNHDIPRLDMKPSIYGDVSSFTADRACRLLEFYKAAYVLTGDSHWEELYLEKVEEEDRARLSCYYGLEPRDLNQAVFAVTQSQVAFRLLYETETDLDIRSSYEEALRAEALSVIEHIPLWREVVQKPLGKALPPRWREFWPTFFRENPDYDPSVHKDVEKWHQYYRQCLQDYPSPESESVKAKPAIVDSRLRHPVDALATVMLCEDASVREQAAETAWPMLSEVEWSLVPDARVVACLDLGYWLGVKAGLFPK